MSKWKKFKHKKIDTNQVIIAKHKDGTIKEYMKRLGHQGHFTDQNGGQDYWHVYSVNKIKKYILIDDEQ